MHAVRRGGVAWSGVGWEELFFFFFMEREGETRKGVSEAVYFETGLEWGTRSNKDR